MTENIGNKSKTIVAKHRPVFSVSVLHFTQNSHQSLGFFSLFSGLKQFQEVDRRRQEAGSEGTSGENSTVSFRIVLMRLDTNEQHMQRTKIVCSGPGRTPEAGSKDPFGRRRRTQRRGFLGGVKNQSKHSFF